MSANGRAPTDVYCQYDVVKVKPGKPVKFLCHSREWESVDTHWYGNHSIRCPGMPDCQQCKDGIARVWKAYILGSMAASEQVLVFQITPLGAYALEEQISNERGLLGAIIRMERKGTRPNSPLVVELRGFVQGTHEVPFKTLEHVVDVLYRTYSKSPFAYNERN